MNTNYTNSLNHAVRVLNSKEMHENTPVFIGILASIRTFQTSRMLSDAQNLAYYMKRAKRSTMFNNILEFLHETGLGLTGNIEKDAEFLWKKQNNRSFFTRLARAALAYGSVGDTRDAVDFPYPADIIRIKEEFKLVLNKARASKNNNARALVHFKGMRNANCASLKARFMQMQMEYQRLLRECRNV